MSSPLNYDIWLHIANLSNEYDLPRLVQVCRNLYDFITPEIYTSVTGLRTPYAVISFCKSALSNPPQRSHRLSNLAIDFDDFIDDPASCAVLAINLASLLRQAAQLESLSISCVEELLCAEPQLAKALAEAPKLRQLYLQGKHPQVGTLACRTVERMQNLRVITLDFRIEREEGVWRAGFFQRSTPLPRLAVVLLPFKTSLRVLNIKGSGPPPLSKWSVRFQRSWTALRELTITSMRTADAPFLAEAFPNLRYLYATTSTPLINVTTTPGTGTTWSSGTLDTFEGNYSCFVFIPLWCPIRRLDLATQETHGLRQHSLHDAYLLYVLEKSCPSVVSIRVKLGRPKEFYIELSRRLSNVRYLRLVLDEGSGVEGSLDFLVRVSSLAFEGLI
ncbi:hypothetical protein JAAARDRAFT_76827 [Jaapia argillacea MUCL 33604]|uniref:F-box domain-containing protein n=1 Tax=Jaapia argillacea MUCL 33604 TaxID=933084 RepID=A0A067QER5_9AGAM|nr:hypothetical protein JAAARDRAFT_76827 [Jaapia argillacea MUCL 33604]